MMERHVCRIRGPWSVHMRMHVRFCICASHLVPCVRTVHGIHDVCCCREGLDWLVHECSLRGLRVLPVLTNGGSTQGGGMKQYIDWVDAHLTVTDFYTNDTVKV